MKTIKEVVRQPLKSIAGMVMAALAVAILVTCVGQYAATKLTRANLDDGYDTIALLSDSYFWEATGNGQKYRSELPEEIRIWVDETLRERTDLVKAESFTRLYSAYIPGVSPDNFSRHENGDYMNYNADQGNGDPYRCAMLEITLTAVGTVVTEKTRFAMGGSDEEWQEILESVKILCTGTVERVIGMEQGFASPVGNTIALTIQVPAEEDLAAMDLQVGQRYLIYGMDYSDVHGDRLYSHIGAYQDSYEELFGAAPIGLNGPEYGPIMEQIGCYMTVCDYASLPDIYFDNGSITASEDWRYFGFREDGVLYYKYVEAEGFIADYGVPTMVKLDGTAEDYLNTDAGRLWQKALDEMQINNHGFPVLAVEKLDYQVAFARGEARIVEGRDFTEEERTTGAKVCVISETVALQNGLSVGDCISMQTYGFDPNIEVQSSILSSLYSCFPSAAVYSEPLGFTSEPEQYTIVGLYRQNNTWQNQGDVYGFTPNVIFVPMGSMSGDYKVGTRGIYYTLVLHNGKMKEFQTLQAEAGYPNLFICLDQGYTEIVDGLDAYEGVSANALYIGIAGSAVILILFLILFPCRQGKTLATMSSLGASRGRRISHIVVSALALLLPGAVLGGSAGVLLWERAAEALMGSVNVRIPLEANMTVLAPCLTLAIVVFMTIVILFAAVLMSGNRGLMRRK